MRYLDSGRRDAEETLGHWLNEVLREAVVELRWQTGFFGANALRWVDEVLRNLRQVDGLVHAVVGSNNTETSDADVHALAEALGIPRSSARLGVVAFSGAYFHPKTLHVRFKEDRQVAYVGSANLTLSGLSGLHVEAGLLLDTAEGDDPAMLEVLAAAVDSWFVDPPRQGVHHITSEDDISNLLARGILRDASATPTPSSEASPPSGRRAPSLPALRPLLGPPPGSTAFVPARRPPQPRGVPAPPAAPTPAPSRPVETRTEHYPEYLLFAPTATTPTSDREGLTGQALPSGAPGLIVRLNRDSARHFTGTTGTCNISVPVDTLRTVRFGIFEGVRQRPRVEFPINIHFLGSLIRLGPIEAQTNIMGYGFHPEETGHGDIRLLVPANVRGLAQEIEARGAVLPGVNAYAWLVWPTEAGPRFTLIFLEPGSPAHDASQVEYERSAARGELVGQGASWLPSDLLDTYLT